MLLAKYEILINIFGFAIHTYAVCILLGALTCYFFTLRLAVKHGYPRSMVYDAFLVVFPMGLVGARIWYYFANIREFDNIFQLFQVWNGGLAVQGGVVIGALSGIIYFKKRYPKEVVRFWGDLIVPNILIAQVIGRWGNFFNNEVYGDCVSATGIWKFLPNFMIKQLGEYCSPGKITLPLFLIEGFINLIGFILISFVLREKWRKGRVVGDLAALYFIWYGIVRIILEQFRTNDFVMRMWDGGPASTTVFSALMIIGGIGFIIYNHFFLPRPKQEYEYSDVLDKVEGVEQ